MKYSNLIEDNLLNNFMDRREMVQIMLEDLESDENIMICEKLKKTNFGNQLKNDLSEKEYFNKVAYYFLQKDNESFKHQFFLYAKDYLNTFASFEDVLRYQRLFIK